MLNLKCNEQKTNCKHSLCSAVFLPLAFRLTSKPCVKLRWFIVFTCNKQKQMTNLGMLGIITKER